MNDMRSFEKGSAWSAVIRNAVPSMFAMLMVLVYNLADTFFIGMTHDDLQVAAVSLGTPVFLIFMGIGTLFGMGGTSVISRALGNNKKEYATKVCSFCMWACIAAGIILMAAMWIFMEPLLNMIGARGDTYEFTNDFKCIF